MYKASTITLKYFLHLLKANNRHGIHSPFVYTFLDDVLYRNRKKNTDIKKIEAFFKKLKKTTTTVQAVDLGAGSTIVTKKRTVGDFARKSIIPCKQGRLLYRLAKYYRPDSILELGTNLGKSIAYLSAGNPGAKIISIEGNPDLAALAKANLQQLNFSNTTVVNGDFGHALPEILDQLNPLGLVFIDGNHRYSPTLSYMETILPKLEPGGLMVFHDIHYSPEMEKAWSEIVADPRFHVTMDLFFMGIASLRPWQEKEHFSIRF